MKALGLMALCLVGGLALSFPARSLEPEEQLASPALEARARTISRELRCVVCQGETIDDSAAPVAKALRILVRERLQAGDSDEQAISAVTARYGEFVLLKPRLSWRTFALWVGPFFVLAAGSLSAFAYTRSQVRSLGLQSPLTEEERSILERDQDASSG